MKRLILLTIFSLGCYAALAQNLNTSAERPKAEAVCPTPSNDGIKVSKNGPCQSSSTFDVGLADYYASSTTSACSILAARNITEVEWQVYPPAGTYSITWGTGVFQCIGVTNSGFSLTFNPTDPNMPISFLFRVKNNCGEWSDWSAGFAIFKNRCGNW